MNMDPRDPHDYKQQGVKLEISGGLAPCRSHGMSEAIYIKSGPDTGYEVCLECFWLAVRNTPQETAAEKFERLAHQFYRETGMMAPGKSMPAAMGDSPTYEERLAKWLEWRKEKGSPLP